MVYLIRHGLTQANKENRFAGRSSESLCAEGSSQLREVTKKLQSAGINRIFCGPLPRTRQSADLISQACGAAVESREGLNEMFLPHWDGLTKDEIRGKFGPEYPTWLSHPAKFQVEGCETLEDVQKRAVDCVKEIVSLHPDKTVLLVTHLIVARCLILHERQLPLAQFRSIQVANGEIVPLGSVKK
ncbi:MAG: histidine phosphatase family protein [Thermodesulfobacteriota bacterium]|nr:histidine phosphatase family protein [Thermodesulfobacteriota bacterium]